MRSDREGENGRRRINVLSTVISLNLVVLGGMNLSVAGVVRAGNSVRYFISCMANIQLIEAQRKREKKMKHGGWWM